ncbi:excalibur calcium-binding domain-containing protein [Fictibacillus sp. KIGAM418]|uniref:Excalibur calcium-binding domain-containing protein n=1 Tax=Fictibacillus marinisediminis TaxID=2878389 RepID=A0A9X1XF50_9BACL|nr:excalibur calcium-binding domain-containing protein [Fictibacillus marinisediminis]MCK6259536.1 excalibur calcium-binding domain-containing protein [Fictibacillus marinisediminis]
MKKLSTFLLTCGLVVGLSSGVNAEAKTSVTKVKTYENCTALNKDYKGGVARSKNVKNKGGKTHYKPYVSKALYDANKSKDRDKDHIACER